MSKVNQENNGEIEFAIKYVMKVYKEGEFVLWANRWISGEDRSNNSALEAEEAAALKWQRAETLSQEWKAAKAAWEVAWAARLLAMKYEEKAVGAAASAIAWAGEIE